MEFVGSGNCLEWLVVCFSMGCECECVWWENDWKFEIMNLPYGKWDNVDLCIWYIKWVVIFFLGDGNGGGVFANVNLKKKNMRPISWLFIWGMFVWKMDQG